MSKSQSKNYSITITQKNESDISLSTLDVETSNLKKLVKSLPVILDEEIFDFKGATLFEISIKLKS